MNLQNDIVLDNNCIVVLRHILNKSGKWWLLLNPNNDVSKKFRKMMSQKNPWNDISANSGKWLLWNIRNVMASEISEICQLGYNLTTIIFVVKMTTPIKSEKPSAPLIINNSKKPQKFCHCTTFWKMFLSAFHSNYLYVGCHWA